MSSASKPAPHQPFSHFAPDGCAHLVDVSSKPATARSATAEGFVRISAELQQRIAENTLAKGSLLEIARIAGIQAAKRTDELIPLCHALPLDAIDVTAELTPGAIHITATVSTHARTGVEMEALTAAAVACLTVIDMGKAVDRGMVIEGLRVLEKWGGASGHHRAAADQHRATDPPSHERATRGKPIRAAILTVSDRCARGDSTDTSGPALAQLLQSRLDAEIVATRCVPDDQEPIAACFREWSQPHAAIDLILSTGGTGLSPRDVTPEAARSVFDRDCTALMDLSRARSLPSTPRAFLSRGVAGIHGRTLIITLPGSLAGATATLESLLDILPHGLEVLAGCTR